MVVEKIYSNTQFTYYDLRIGVGNFFEKEYTEGVVKKVGPTAGLALYYRNKSELNQKITVYQNMKILVGKYNITVLQISKDENGNYVKIEIVE